MNGLTKETGDHIICIDKLLNFSSFTDKALIEWYNSLVDVMTEEGALQYLLGESREFYNVSTLASVIIAMK